MLLSATAANVAARDEWLVGGLPRWKWLTQYMRSDMDEGASSRLMHHRYERCSISSRIKRRQRCAQRRHCGRTKCDIRKASDFCFLVLLFLTPTVRHANIWGILRVRTPSAAKIGSVFDRCSASSLWNYCHPGRTRSHERVVHRDSPANAPSPATTTTGGMRSQLA
jgi:hypothetical protein